MESRRTAAPSAEDPDGEHAQPGLAGVPMVTVVHRAAGRVLGGVSFALRQRERTKKSG